MTRFDPSANAQILLQGLSLGNQVRQQRERHALDVIKTRLLEEQGARYAEEFPIRLQALHLGIESQRQGMEFQKQDQDWQQQDRAYVTGQREQLDRFTSAWKQTAATSSPTARAMGYTPEVIAEMTPDQVVVTFGKDMEATGQIGTAIAFQSQWIKSEKQKIFRQAGAIDAAVAAGLLPEPAGHAQKSALLQQAKVLDRDDYIFSIRRGLEGMASKAGVNQKVVGPMVEGMMMRVEQVGYLEPRPLSEFLDMLGQNRSIEGEIAERMMEAELVDRELAKNPSVSPEERSTTRARIVSGQPVGYGEGGGKKPPEESVDELDAKQRYEAAAKRLTGLEDQLSDAKAEKGDDADTKTLEKQIDRVRQNVSVLRRNWDNLRRQRVGSPQEDVDAGVVRPREDGPVEIKGVGTAAPGDVSAALAEWIEANPKKKDERNEQYKERARKAMAKQFGGG